MAMPAVRRRWTPEDVRSLMDETRAWPRYELIAGELVVTPAPGVAHQIIVTELWAILDGYLKWHPIGLPLVSPSDLELRPGTITQPDVFVVPIRQDPGETGARWSDIRSLLLAVEVLSPSSLRTDRVEKRDLYLDAGVAEYWVVDIDARVVERWTPTHATPEILRAELAWPAASMDPLVIDLPALFERVARKTGMVRL